MGDRLLEILDPVRPITGTGKDSGKNEGMWAMWVEGFVKGSGG